ncbi:hypothetical protein STENM223S_01134 [Streptomyces tendae]
MRPTYGVVGSRPGGRWQSPGRLSRGRVPPRPPCPARPRAGPAVHRVGRHARICTVRPDSLSPGGAASQRRGLRPGRRGLDAHGDDAVRGRTRKAPCARKNSVLPIRRGPRHPRGRAGEEYETGASGLTKPVGGGWGGSGGASSRRLRVAAALARSNATRLLRTAARFSSESTTRRTVSCPATLSLPSRVFWTAFFQAARLSRALVSPRSIVCPMPCRAAPQSGRGTVMLPTVVPARRSARERLRPRRAGAPLAQKTVTATVQHSTDSATEPLTSTQQATAKQPTSAERGDTGSDRGPASTEGTRPGGGDAQADQQLAQGAVGQNERREMVGEGDEYQRDERLLDGTHSGAPDVLPHLLGGIKGVASRGENLPCAAADQLGGVGHHPR